MQQIKIISSIILQQDEVPLSKSLE